MATLYAIVYPDAATAEQAEQTMRGLSEAGYLDILDSSLVTKNSDGKIEHHGERHSAPPRRGRWRPDRRLYRTHLRRSNPGHRGWHSLRQLRGQAPQIRGK